MRVIGVLAAVLLSVAALSDGARADGKDDDAAQTCLDQFYAAAKKGDAVAMTALLEPSARKAAKSDREKLAPWPEGSTSSTLHRHVEGNWGLFWVKIDHGPSKEPAPEYLSKAQIEVLRRGYSETQPMLLHRIDGQWCFAFAGFAPAEIDEIFHGRPESAPPWMVHDYLDWVVESWRKSPESHPIELDKPSGPVEVSPERPAAFLVELTKIVRLRAVVTSEADVEPSVSIESPAGGSYGSRGTKRRAVGISQLTTGAILLVVRTKTAGKVIVEATAATDPTRLELNAAAGPFRLRTADRPEFSVSSKQAKDVAFAAIPIGETASNASCGIETISTFDKPRPAGEIGSETGHRGLSDVTTVEGSTVFRLFYDGDTDIDVLVAAVPTTGTPDLTRDQPVEIDVEPGKPRFLRLAVADAAAELVLIGAAADAGANFVRFSAGKDDQQAVGIVVYARAATHVRVAFLRR